MKKLLLLITILSMSAFATEEKKVGSCLLESSYKPGIYIYLTQGTITDGKGYIDAEQVLNKVIKVNFRQGMWKAAKEIERLIVSSEDGTTGFSGYTGYRGNGKFMASIDGNDAICKIDI